MSALLPSGLDKVGAERGEGCSSRVLTGVAVVKNQCAALPDIHRPPFDFPRVGGDDGGNIRSPLSGGDERPTAEPAQIEII